MTPAKSLLSKIFSPIQGYGLALASVAIALGLNLFLFSHTVQSVEFPIFVIAISITVWYGGPGPGIFALVLAALAFNYYFTEPYYSFYITRSELPYYATFIIFALLVTWFATLRRRVERRLVQSRDELQRQVAMRTQQGDLLNLTHDSIFVRDMSGVISYWNHGAQELYGWTAEQAVGKRTNELLHTVFPGPFEEIQSQLLTTGRWEGELQKKKATGEGVVVASRWSLQRDDHQNPIAILETETT
jgi:PAS domain S-box-containing protein